MAGNTKEIIGWVEQRKQRLNNSSRKNFENLWQRVSDLFCPNRADFTVKRSGGQDRANHLYNSIGVICASSLAADMHSMLTDPSGVWFSYAFGEKMSKKMDEWLIRQTETVYHYMYSPAAGLAQALDQSYLDDATIGTDMIYSGWNDQTNGLLYQAMSVSEWLIDEDHNGIPDTAVRSFKMRPMDVLALYGKNIPAEVADKLKKEMQDQVNVIHAIFPAGHYNGNICRQPIASVIYLADGQICLETAGYDDFPFAITRYDKVNGEVYGRSPAMSSLADVAALQEITKESLISAQIANRPMMLVKDDETINVPVYAPGKQIVYGETPPSPYNAGNNYKPAMEMIANLEDRTKKNFSLYKINDLQGTHRTREEILQRIAEASRLLGPLAGRQQSEKFDRLLLRTFNLCARHGVLEPPPEDVEFINLRIRYNSAFNRMKRLEKASGYSQAYAVMEPFLALKPQSIENLDGDKIIREIASVFDAPEMLLDQNAVAANRQVQAAAVEQQNQIAAAQTALQLQSMDNSVRMQDSLVQGG